MTTTAHKTLWRWEGDPFGVGGLNADVDGDGVSIIYNWRFPGQFYDGETGLYYNYFRDYEPGVGRYVESDPIGLRGGVNTYGYVGADPLQFIDSEGLAATTAIGGTIGGLLGGPGGAAIGAGIGSLIGVTGYIWYNQSEENQGCKPSKKDCSMAIKLLEQVDRLAQKLGKKLPQKRLDELRKKISDGSITSADLPADIQNEFPSELRYKTLIEIRKICGKER